MNERVSLEEVRRQQYFEAPNPGYITPKIHGVVDPITLDGKPIPERRWLVDDWIPAGNVTMVSGDGGLGKSLLSQQLLTCCVVGRAWLGQHTKPCRAVGMFCEDSQDELHRRQDAINQHYGIDFADLENLQWVSRIGENNALMRWEQYEEAGQATELYQQIHDLTQDFGAQLLVLDSLHDLFSGNENSRPHARQFVQLLSSLARDMGDHDGAVVLTAHPSLSGLNTGSGMSGSTAWNNAVRSRLYLTHPKDEDGNGQRRDERTLQRKKANYAGAGGELELRWKDGVFCTEEQPTGIFGTISRNQAETVFLDCLDAMTERGSRPSESKHSGNYAPKVMARMPESGRLKQRDLESAMYRLFTQKVITNKEYGPPSRAKMYIVKREPLE